MKNVTCRKLLIDRQKAPEKVGTLKDISLYGSFEFQHCGGKNNNNNNSNNNIYNDNNNNNNNNKMMMLMMIFYL